MASTRITEGHNNHNNLNGIRVTDLGISVRICDDHAFLGAYLFV
jgi:hypothetical protein